MLAVTILLIGQPPVNGPFSLARNGTYIGNYPKKSTKADISPISCKKCILYSNLNLLQKSKLYFSSVILFELISIGQILGILISISDTKIRRFCKKCFVKFCEISNRQIKKILTLFWLAIHHFEKIWNDFFRKLIRITFKNQI